MPPAGRQALVARLELELQRSRTFGYTSLPLEVSDKQAELLLALLRADEATQSCSHDWQPVFHTDQGVTIWGCRCGTEKVYICGTWFHRIKPDADEAEPPEGSDARGTAVDPSAATNLPDMTPAPSRPAGGAALVFDCTSGTYPEN